MTESILRIRDVQKVTGLCRSSIYAKIAQSEFPRPIKLGERASGWLASEVSAWLKTRVDASRRGAG